MSYFSHLERYYVTGIKDHGGGVVDTFDKKFSSRAQASKMKQHLLSEGYTKVDFGILK